MVDIWGEEEADASWYNNTRKKKTKRKLGPKIDKPKLGPKIDKPKKKAASKKPAAKKPTKRKATPTRGVPKSIAKSSKNKNPARRNANYRAATDKTPAEKRTAKKKAARSAGAVKRASKDMKRTVAYVTGKGSTTAERKKKSKAAHDKALRTSRMNRGRTAGKTPAKRKRK